MPTNCPTCAELRKECATKHEFIWDVRRLCEKHGIPDGPGGNDEVAWLDKRLTEIRRLMDGMEMAWAVIANAGHKQRGWDSEHPEWVECAERWRDEHWHPSLKRNVHPEATGQRPCATCNDEPPAVYGCRACGGFGRAGVGRP